MVVWHVWPNIKTLSFDQEFNPSLLLSVQEFKLYQLLRLCSGCLSRWWYPSLLTPKVRTEAHQCCHTAHREVANNSARYLGSPKRVGSCVFWLGWGSGCSPTASTVNVDPTGRTPALGEVSDVRSMVWTGQSLAVGTTVRKRPEKNT